MPKKGKKANGASAAAPCRDSTPELLVGLPLSANGYTARAEAPTPTRRLGWPAVEIPANGVLPAGRRTD